MKDCKNIYLFYILLDLMQINLYLKKKLKNNMILENSKIYNIFLK